MADKTRAPASARLFVALWPPPAVRRSLAGWRNACTWPAGAAVVATPKLHLTLHFIGNVPAQRLSAVADGLQVPGPHPFELQLAQCEMWPRGLVVLQPRETPAALLALHAACAAALRTLELPVEPRAFRAHVTLARDAPGARLHQRRSPLRWPIDGYALVRSWPGDGGRYEVLRRYS